MIFHYRKILVAAAPIVCLVLQAAASQLPPGSQLWSFSTPYQILSSPALGPDGTVYLGTHDALYAITNAGSNKWTFPIGLMASPSVGSAGEVYFAGSDGRVYALNADGSQRWTYSVQSEFGFKITLWSAPAIGADGSIYIIAAARVYAFSPVGMKKWDYAIDDFPGSTPPHALSPAIGPEGTIFAASIFRSTLYAINPDGSEKWHFAMDNAGGESAAIAPNGTVYITGFGLYALAPNGQSMWETPMRACCSPVLARDGTIYINNPDDLSLWSIRPNGQTNWNIAAAGPFYPPPPTTPAVVDDGTVYYCNSNSLFALTPNGTTLWTFAVPYNTGGPIPGCFSSPVVGPDGIIYAGFASTLYAIAGTNRLADSTWPMYRQNVRHTGRIEKPSVTKPQKRADANFQFQIYDTLGNTNTIQASTDLASWTSLTDIVVTNIPMDFIDYTASNFASRFYRTIQQ